MNSDYIKEELELLLKDKLILDFKLIEDIKNDEGFEISEVKKIFITTLENNLLEICIKESLCYKVELINSVPVKEESNGNANCLFEDLSNLINKHSNNFREKFNKILHEKLSKLQRDDDEEEEE